MNLTPRLRAAFLLCGLFLVGGAISAPSQGKSCPPCNNEACYTGCGGGCGFHPRFNCEICICPP